MLNKLRRCERGASIVEMALAAPILAALLIGMTDISRAYSMKLQLVQASQRTIEKLQQMSAPADPNNSSTISTEGANAATAAGYTGSTVTVTYRNECNGTATTNYTDSCTTGQTQMKYVVVQISNSFTPMFGVTYFPTHNANGTVTLSGQAGIRVQ
ncbi:MAG TPA: TadE/TadG family type IV pilus assembly protein [Sphingomicrobium sp.]